MNFEIAGSHSCAAKNSRLLGHDFVVGQVIPYVSKDRCSFIFRRRHGFSKYREHLTRRRGVTSKKSWILNISACLCVCGKYWR